MGTTVEQLYPDIWQQIFEYFNPIELFYSFVHVTIAADEVLFNKNHHLHLRKLTIHAYIETLPEKLAFSQIISLELHEESGLDIIEKCLELRSLTLTGQTEWVICLLEKVSFINMKLEQLVLIVPGIAFLYDLLASVASLDSLRRLSICANQSEQKIKRGSLSMTQTKIECFSLHSCSSVTCNELLYMLPVLSDIHFLDITLFHDNKDLFASLCFPKLRYTCLKLLEVPFRLIIQLVKTIPSLIKIKLNGLIDAEGFVINHKWFHLFQSCPFLDTVTVNVALERDINFHCIDIIRTALSKINLNLVCIDDDSNYYSDERNQHRWWSLSGIINKQHEHIQL